MTEQELYKKRVRNAFDKFLASKFVEYAPYSISDDRIVSDAKERSNINYNGGRLQLMQSFASIVTIEGAKDMEYNGHYFKSLFLRSNNGKQIRINFSDFQYYTSLCNGEHKKYSFEYDYDESNARYINMLDDKVVLPDSLASRIGEQILWGYDFTTVNSFRNLRTCYRFYSLGYTTEQKATIIRKQILRAQAIALLIAAKYPVLCLPSNNYERIYPYMYEITKEIGYQYTQKLMGKLYEIEQVLSKHGLTYEDNI